MCDAKAGERGSLQYASKLDDFEGFVAHAKLASLSLQRSAPQMENAASLSLSQPRLSQQPGSQQGSSQLGRQVGQTSNSGEGSAGTHIQVWSGRTQDWQSTAQSAQKALDLMWCIRPPSQSRPLSEYGRTLPRMALL